jgi:cold shock protein
VVVVAQLGRILQFDAGHGYGFIAPDAGGDDIFVHANDFDEDEARFSPGTRVEFEVMESGRGRRAFAVQLAEDSAASARPGRANAAAASPAKVSAAPVPAAKQPSASEDDGMCDVLNSEELRSELVEMFLSNSPELTGAQIVRLRGDFLALAQKHGWVEE